ncbi:MAG: hypothetical protein O4808_19280, partial [Trichodesmium sp. St17_bin3_1_1]|nr:hypothetical protein [Trichodesmium sp. St17_bin3_1_1]
MGFSYILLLQIGAFSFDAPAFCRLTHFWSYGRSTVPRQFESSYFFQEVTMAEVCLYSTRSLFLIPCSS